MPTDSTLNDARVDFLNVLQSRSRRDVQWYSDYDPMQVSIRDPAMPYPSAELERLQQVSYETLRDRILSLMTSPNTNTAEYDLPSSSAGTQLQRRLNVSALYTFANSPHAREKMREKLDKATIKCPEDLRKALGILQMGSWFAFLDDFFLAGGVSLRKFRMHWHEARRPDTAWAEDLLDDLRAQASINSNIGVEEIGLSAQPAGNQSSAEVAKLVGEYEAKFNKLLALGKDADVTIAALTKQLEAARNQGPVTVEVVRQGKPSVTVKTAHFLLPRLLKRIGAGVNTYLVGPAGGGKTTLAHQAAEALALPFGAMSVGPQTTKTDIVGYMNATGGYVPTEFRRRFQDGGVFLFDEMDAGNPGVFTCVNAALANPLYAFPDGMIPKHEEFVCIAAGNTFGTGPDRQYVGRQELDAASIDRFNFLEMPYDEGLELSVAKGISAQHYTRWTAFVQEMRRAVQALGIRHVVSPRATFDGLRLLEADLPWDEVEQTQLWKGLKPDEVKRIKASVAPVDLRQNGEKPPWKRKPNYDTALEWGNAATIEVTDGTLQ